MTEPSYTLRDAALAVECPTCFADPGCVCCSDDGEAFERVHVERIETLRGYVRDGVAAYERSGMNP